MAIQIRRGTEQEWETGKSNIIVGEPAITTDTGRLFVGTGEGTYQEFLKVAEDGSINTNKIISTDQADTEYPLICDNGTNLWLGAPQTASRHHVGATFISAGYNPSTQEGFSTVNIVVPNSTNTGGTARGIWHAGNLERFYSNAEVNASISRSSCLVYGLVGSGSSSISIFVPYPVTGGTPTLTDLSLNVAIPGNAYVRSGSSGGTYTNISGSNVSMIANGRAVRSNEITDHSVIVVKNMGFRVTLTLKYPMSTTSGSATTLANKTSFTGWATFTITLA